MPTCQDLLKGCRDPCRKRVPSWAAEPSGRHSFPLRHSSLLRSFSTVLPTKDTTDGKRLFKEHLTQGAHPRLHPPLGFPGCCPPPGWRRGTTSLPGPPWRRVLGVLPPHLAHRGLVKLFFRNRFPKEPKIAVSRSVGIQELKMTHGSPSVWSSAPTPPRLFLTSLVECGVQRTRVSQHPLARPSVSRFVPSSRQAVCNYVPIGRCAF